MKLRAYSIFDMKGLIYHPPFFASTDGQAVRSLTDAVADPNTSLNRHPADYALFYVGTYDDATAQLVAEHPIVKVVDAVAVVRLQPRLAFEQPLDSVERDVRPNGGAHG